MNVSKWYVLENQVAISYELKIIMRINATNRQLYTLVKNHRFHCERARCYHPPVTAFIDENYRVALELYDGWTII